MDKAQNTHDHDAGWFDGRLHKRTARVYYEDTDLSGVVFHANYVRYFERGRTDFLRMVGLAHQSLLARDPPLAFAITAMDLRFLKPAKIDDSLLIVTGYDALVGVRLKISQDIFRGTDHIASAKVEAVSIDLSGRPRRLFPEMVAAIKSYLLAPKA